VSTPVIRSGSPSGRPWKKTISVNRQALQRGEPPISVKVRGKTYAADGVYLEGRSQIRFDPAKKRQPRVVLETTSQIVIDLRSSEGFLYVVD